MNGLNRVWLLCLVWFLGQGANGGAIVADGPYCAIPQRNVFNLQPLPPPAPPIQPVAPPKVMPQVLVTGLTDICGPRQVLVEMAEPGKPSTRAVLMEGERAGPLEVVEIDIKKGQVKVNIHGEESVLMLRDPSSTVSPPTRPPVRLPPLPGRPVLP